ncbi:hypothetical protein JCM3774_001588 [Rhodotorula dairenensis]
MKRLILLCDGTLEDADLQKDPARYTNIARLARGLSDLDTRSATPVEQIKLCQGGVGTDEAVAGGLVAGMLGRGMRRKVKSLYDFLALNWQPGDEIHLFGFSRGAYTVRLLCSLLDVIGILPPRSYLELFPALFEALDAHTGKGGEDDAEAQAHLQELMKPILPFRTAQLAALGKRKLVECLGVFDTVGTRGRPAALRRSSPFETRYNSFGFDETRLPNCVARTYQALALDEHRIDYLPVLFRRPSSTSSKQSATDTEQELLQVWFSGAHSDIGGSYPEGDLAAISLWWMVSCVQDALAFDYGYLKRTLAVTHAHWGQCKPHNSLIPPYVLAKRVERPYPVANDKRTNQFFHPSIRSQPDANLRPDLLAYLQSVHFDPRLFVELSPLEQQIERTWPAPTLSTEVPTRKARIYMTDDFALGDRPSSPSSVTSFTDNESDRSGPSTPASVNSLTDNESEHADPALTPAAPSSSQSAARASALTEVVAIDPSLEGQYAAPRTASSHQYLAGPGRPGEVRGSLEPPHKRAARSAAGPQSSFHEAAAATHDYTDRLMDLLNGTSGSAPPPPLATTTTRPPMTSATATPSARAVPGLVSNAFEARPDFASALQRSEQSPANLYALPSDYGFAALGPSGEGHSRCLATSAPEHTTNSLPNSVLTGMPAAADAPGPPVAGPSRASSARASPANPVSLPDTFPEPPNPVNAEDGSLPQRSEFAEALEAYIQSLHPIKRNKALMPRELYDLVIDILRKPQDTTVGDPQLRFWVRQRFQLMCGPGERYCALHEGKRVVLRDELYDVVARAHIDSHHGGRDKTYNALRKEWSYVPKETAAAFIKLCAVCNGKRAKEKQQAAERQERKRRTGTMPRAPAPAPPPQPSPSEMYGLPVNLANALGQAPVEFNGTATGSVHRPPGYLSALDPYGTTDTSSMALPVPPELAVALADPSPDGSGPFAEAGGSSFTTAAYAAAAAAAMVASQQQQSRPGDISTSSQQH